MGKRYKKGNHGKKRKRQNDDFYQREIILNKKIADFRNSFYQLKNPPSFDEYYVMNKKRMDIKSLLDLQGKDLSQPSWRRRTFYYLQLDKFKRIYTRGRNILTIFF